MEKFCLDCESEKKCQIGSRRRRASADVVARAQALSPGWRRRRLSVEVWGVGEKTPLPRGTRRRTGVDVVARVHTNVVARTQALSPRRRRRRSSVEVWGVGEKTPLPRGTRRRTGACVVARAHASSRGHKRFRPGVHVVARARSLCPGADGSGRPTKPAHARRCCRPRWPRLRRNLRGYKRPRLPFSPHFPSIRSFLAWTCPPAAPCENLMDRTFLIVLFVYVNRISAPFITFIFLITSVRSTCLAACKNGEAEERDKGVGAMVYVATGWTYGELCVLWKHNAVQKRTGL